jgi:hypothetical protein
MWEPGQGAQLPRTARRAGLILAAVALGAAGTAVADRTVAKRGQLDGDARLERVERRFVDCPRGTNAPQARDQCGYVAIVDRGRTHRLTRTTQRPKTDYGWTPLGPVRLRDLTGDGRSEVLWQLSTAGGTGSSPRRYGVHRWTGRRAVRIFVRNDRRASRGRYALPVRLDVLPLRRGLRELRLRDLLYRRNDSTCCPSFVRTSRYRWDGERMRLVRGSTRVRRT